MTAPEQPQSPSLRDEIVAELRSIQEDVFWTEKTHFALADTYSRIHLILGVVATVSAAAAATSVVAKGAPALSAIMAVIAAITSALLTFVKPEETEQEHLSVARRLGALRVKIRQGISLDLHSSQPEQANDWRVLVSGVADQKAEIDATAPGTSNRAFDAARKKIEKGHFDHETR